MSGQFDKLPAAEQQVTLKLIKNFELQLGKHKDTCALFSGKEQCDCGYKVKQPTGKGK